MRTRALWMLVAAVPLAATSAAASSLGGVGSADLAAGSATIQSCDTNFTITYGGPDASTVDTVTVGDIASACVGGTLSLTVTGTGGSSLAQGSASVVGDTATVTLGASVTATNVTGTQLVIVGP